MYKENTKKIVLISLFSIAVVLALINYRSNIVSYFSTTQEFVEKTGENFEDRSLEEKKVLAVPGPGASQEEIDEHSRLALKLSVSGSEIEINECMPKPLVLQSKLGLGVTFKNIGTKNISLSFDGQKFIDIEAGKSVVNKEVFVHGVGLYGYLCKTEGFSGVTGFVSIIEN